MRKRTRPKTYAEINENIRNGRAVVVTAEETISIVEEKGAAEAAEDADMFPSVGSSYKFKMMGERPVEDDE